MDIDADLVGIANLMRRHIEIRNRSWLKRIHRDCFVGSEAVDFLVMQGFAESRKSAVDIGVKMTTRKLIRNITDSRKFSDSLHFYRFTEDDQPNALLHKTNAGHVPGGSCVGHGGCKWSFAPHTAHNSFILDIALAEEIERAVAGASLEARARAINKMRSRVKEEAEPDAPNWDLNQTMSVNGTQVNVFTRTRPRGDWKNIKMTGVVPETPVQFLRSILSFERRRQWESAFEDGVLVEGIETGEAPNTLISDSVMAPAATADQSQAQGLALPESIIKERTATVARATDDLYTFLATVDLAGVPEGMAVAFLNDPERQHALAHLRKQMLLSQPQECMLCGTAFTTITTESGTTLGGDMRFCPCCAMVSCAGCVSKRVFEVVSRTITSVCVHCYRESSRIFQPPQAVQDDTTIDERLRGKWWRPEELGLADYSHGTSGRTGRRESSQKSASTMGDKMGQEKELYNEDDQLTVTAATAAQLKPLIPGLLDDIIAAANGDTTGNSRSAASASATATTGANEDESEGEELNEDDEEDSDEEDDDDEEEVEAQQSAASPAPPPPAPAPPAPTAAPPAAPSARTASMSSNPKMARCKGCGEFISRDIEAIEAHMEECSRILTSGGGAAGDSMMSGGDRSSLIHDAGTNARTQSVTVTAEQGSYVINSDGAVIYTPHSTPRAFALIPRKPELQNKYPTRIIYRTARTSLASLGGAAANEQTAKSKVVQEQRTPREVCALQDCFVDPRTGACYAYEVSVRHSDVRGIGSRGHAYMTADVHALLYVARPLKSGQGSQITILSQIDTREHSSKWAALELSGYLGGLGRNLGNGKSDIAGVRKQDLVRELQACKNLTNLLVDEDDNTTDGGSEAGEDRGSKDGSSKAAKAAVSLEDFELLAVLGRGGFGKVMQVRHVGTQEIYAMKILKKSELRRRRQVERTQTERNILANVRHPFIVCLHYAFQNAQKLYMVMDFVQGGDFFTLMRKFKRLPEDWVRLYVMEVALALQHLHEREIVYRDLKPENILLCRDGHLKLTDFGLSRYFETRPPAPEDVVDPIAATNNANSAAANTSTQGNKHKNYLTRSFCGTEQYMSPEMLLQQGHNFRMDWWCLGLLMHEMLTSKHPFQGATHYDTLRNMVTVPPDLESRYLSPGAKGLIKALLVKNPRTRLGGKEGLLELQHVAYLSPPHAPVTWEQLYQKQIEMPYRPRLADAADISSFESTFTNEKPVDSVSGQDARPSQSENGGGQAGSKRGVFSSLFGTGKKKSKTAAAAASAKPGKSKKSEAPADPLDDAFKDFSFAKQEAVAQLSTQPSATTPGQSVIDMN